MLCWLRAESTWFEAIGAVVFGVVHEFGDAVALVDGIGNEGGRVFLQDQEHLAGQFAVGVVVGFAEDAAFRGL